MLRTWKLLLGLLILAVSGAAIAGLSTSNSQTTAQQKVTVKTLDSIDANQGGDAVSSFTNISADAAASGLNNTVLYGAVNVEKISSTQKRVRVTWHTMEKQSLGQSYRQKLETPLESSVVVDVDEIPPQTSMIAKGDLNYVATAFNDLVERENSQPAALPQQQEEEGSEESQALKSGSGRFDTGSSSGTGSSELPESDLNTKEVVEDVSEVVECDYRIDIPGLMIYRQSRTDTVSGENGQLVSQGTCQDTGETIPLTKKFGGECEPEMDEENEQKFLSYKVIGTIDGFEQTVQGCTVDYENPVDVEAIPTTVACADRVDIPGLKLYKQARTDMVSGISGKVLTEGTCQDVGEPIFLAKEYGGDCDVIPDLENRVAYQGFRITGVIDGAKKIIQDCQTDFDNTIEIKSTFSDCGVTNDFVNSVTYQQERLFYLDSKGEHQVRGCADSTTTYAHYSTTATCEPIIDMANGVVFPQTRTAFKNNLAEVSYISDCAIVEGSSGINIQEEVCPTKYEHDFTNGQSYVRKRQYYSMDGEKNYLTECGRSTESYPHLTFTENCGIQNDDANLRTKILGLKAIETPEGVVEISPCEVVDTSSYVYNGYTMKPYTTFPSGVKKTVTNHGSCNGGFGTSYTTTFTWTSGGATLTKGKPWNNTNALNCGGTYGYEGCINGLHGRQHTANCTFTRVRYVAEKDYIRYDGSHYKKWDTSISTQTEARVP